VRRVDTRRVALAAGAVALVATFAAGLLAIVVLERGGAGRSTPRAPQDGLAATAMLQPRIVLFGDTLTARVEVVVDRSAIDVESVRVAWAPAPWRLVRPPERTVETDGTTAHVRTSYVLRCLTRECAPVRPTEEITFPPARVSYPTGDGAGPTRVEAAWPILLVHSRLGGLDSAQRDALAAPWRADFVSLPAVSYRVRPRIAIGLLVALAAILFGSAALATYRAWPRREPEPEPEPPPPPVASALEQALALLESPVAVNGTESRRRALELVADELERVDAELALAARALAWSPHAPEVPATRALASRLRDRLEVNGVPA
jgi:hypothetical protein